MSKTEEEVGTIELPYHIYKKRKYGDLRPEITEEVPISFIIGLFSCSEKDIEKDGYKERLDKNTKVLYSQSDLSACMKEHWQTAANIKIDYKELKEVFPNIDDSNELKLFFEEPNDFLMENLGTIIEKSESGCNDKTKKGLTQINYALKILKELSVFIEENYEKLSKLVAQKKYSNMIDFLESLLLSEDLGSNLISSIEDDIRLSDLA